MEQIVVKTEVQNNGEILLYYVDENGDNQEGVLTTIESIENDSMQIQENSYMLESYDDMVDVPPALQDHIEELNPWSDEDVKRLLIFYNDNKTSFVSGTTQKRHLWAVACKTMLIGKNQQTCDQKLQELKTKYSEVRGYLDKGVYVKWPFLDLCHQAFHDDSLIIESANVTLAPAQIQAKPQPKIVSFKQDIEATNVTPSPPKAQVKTQPKLAALKQETVKNKNGILSVKQMNLKSPNENVEQLLTVYLKYKKNFQKEHWRRDLWDRIAQEMRETDSEYLQKKFLNYKQHYISMYLKRKQQGPSSVNWPYMELFDKIYKDDELFLKKHFDEEPVTVVNQTVPEQEWNMTQTTVLTKYYFDCYEEFEDETIPKKFLWTEVGRLIDKKPETCQTQYQTLREEHLDKYFAGEYDLQKRIPMAIILDNIIAKDVQTLLSKTDMNDFENDLWKEAQLDELVQFFHDNTELFKDKECHFVCWAVIAHKLKLSIESCKYQWDELVILYKQILEEKKEDSDLQIEWRYIELFDRIFDYGMDAELLKGYEVQVHSKSPDPLVVKKVNVKPEDLGTKDPLGEKAAHKKDNPVSKNDEPRTDPRSTKILEYYLKNKDRFQNYNQPSSWDGLAKQIDLNSTQCAHRFKTLKQTYIEQVQREIDKPRTLITWPHYALCKKVFGHRTIKNKLKQEEREQMKKGELIMGPDDWPVRLIEHLISFFAKNFNEITNNMDDLSKWTPLATDIGKSEAMCKEKILELRKSYRKLRTMRTKKPDVKISWIYYDMFESIYNVKDADMEVEALEEQVLMEEEVIDDDYQCIIVLQDGQVILNNSEVIDNPELLQQLTNMSTQICPAKTSKWTKRTKKILLVLYINYVRSHRGTDINPKDMWTSIAARIPNKTPRDCRKFFVKMKNAYKRASETVKMNSKFSSLLEIVVKLKPKFVNSKCVQNKIYKDVPMSPEKVNSALRYYLEHIEDFVNPKFERRYLWTELARHISEPITKVYNKVNYLKQAYDIETDEIEGEKTVFSDLLKEIIAKEVAVKMVLELKPDPEFSDQESAFTDDETKKLLLWYLRNLEKFKNPKFNRSYLWMEASSILNKSQMDCSKKMSEIRTQYRNMVKQGDDLTGWKFSELCQKIYGTGKKSQSSLTHEDMDY